MNLIFMVSYKQKYLELQKHIADKEAKRNKESNDLAVWNVFYESLAKTVGDLNTQIKYQYPIFQNFHDHFTVKIFDVEYRLGIVRDNLKEVEQALNFENETILALSMLDTKQTFEIKSILKETRPFIIKVLGKEKTLEDIFDEIDKEMSSKRLRLEIYRQYEKADNNGKIYYYAVYCRATLEIKAWNQDQFQKLTQCKHSQLRAHSTQSRELNFEIKGVKETELFDLKSSYCDDETLEDMTCALCGKEIPLVIAKWINNNENITITDLGILLNKGIITEEALKTYFETKED